MGFEMMNGWGYMGGWGGMAFGGIIMFFWLALLVGLIVVVVRWLGGTADRHDRADAIDTLRQRFARGEIDSGEFEERSQRLRAAR